MSQFSRNKGKRAEREVVNLLKPIVDKVYSSRGLEVPLVERNLLQSNQGGCDITGIDFLAIEVKYYAQVNNGLLNQWWKQAVEQAQAGQKPILFYRKNQVPWRVRMSIPLCPTLCTSIIDISAEDFLIWFDYQLNMDLSSKDRLENGYT